MTELIEELDRIIPAEDASIVFRQYGGGPDESAIFGSRSGLLRAGIALLRAGVGPASEKKETRELSALRQITSRESQYFFDYFEEQDLPEDFEKEMRGNRLAKIFGCVLLATAIFLSGFAIYGIIRLFT